MRSVELAVYADALAAEAAALRARLERARGRLRQAAIEREAAQALAEEVVARLARLGLLGAAEHVARDAAELEAARLDLAAVQRLQAWIESQLAASSDVGAAGDGRGQDGEEVTQEAQLPPQLGAVA
jgi:hypothetical protein